LYIVCRLCLWLDFFSLLALFFYLFLACSSGRIVAWLKACS
jgi:hypothetical protein